MCDYVWCVGVVVVVVMYEVDFVFEVLDIDEVEVECVDDGGDC